LNKLQKSSTVSNEQILLTLNDQLLSERVAGAGFDDGESYHIVQEFCNGCRSVEIVIGGSDDDDEDDDPLVLSDSVSILVTDDGATSGGGLDEGVILGGGDDDGDGDEDEVVVAVMRLVACFAPRFCGARVTGVDIL